MAKQKTKKVSSSFKAAMPTEGPGRLISKLNHPVTISYNGEAMQLPPRGKEKVSNVKKLGALPRGVLLVKPKKK